MTLIAVMAALICVVGPLTVPLGPIPLTLANFMICLTGAVLGAGRGAAATLIYLLIGSIGVPVFSGFTGGIQRIVGVTGGFLVGYVPCAFITGLGVREGETVPARAWRLPLFMVLGEIALYAIGTGWFVVYKTYLMNIPTSVAEALAACVIPFLLADAVKVVLATIIARPIRRAIYR